MNEITNALYAEIDRLQARVAELEAERDAAVKWLEEYKSKTYCAYCGATFNIDSDATHVTEHIRTCPHHPMRALEAENKRLREALDGIITVAKIICNEFPVGTASLYGWVLIGEKALKEASHESK